MGPPEIEEGHRLSSKTTDPCDRRQTEVVRAEMVRAVCRRAWRPVGCIVGGGARPACADWASVSANQIGDHEFHPDMFIVIHLPPTEPAPTATSQPNTGP